MPARDGTSPLGQGYRTGRGMGSCHSNLTMSSQSSKLQTTQSIHWGGRVWDTTLGRIFRRRRVNQKSWK